jgi:polyphosphate glucokinase
MISGVKKLTEDWRYDAISIGYPGLVTSNRPSAEPNNLGHGWINFDFERAFGVPVKVMNDAAMQALGSYQGGVMLFLGLGTGLGTALVVNETVVPMELGHLTYKQGTYEDLLGLRGLQRLGIKKWREYVFEVVARWVPAFELDDVVIGGGNVNKLDKLPPRCRAGDNALAFRGGFLMWESGKARNANRSKPPQASHDHTTKIARSKAG